MGRIVNLKFLGMDKLQKALKDNVTLDDVKKVVRHHGAELQQKIQKNADFAKGYQTGTTKRSIGLEITDFGMTAETGVIKYVKNPESGRLATKYSPYVEYGTRFMDAQPFVRPAYNEQKEKFKKDMDKLVR